MDTPIQPRLVEPAPEQPPVIEVPPVKNTKRKRKPAKLRIEHKEIVVVFK